MLELCAKFGSHISYGPRERRSFVPHVRLMTSRELTSGFDFLVHVVISGHLLTKFDADIFNRYGDIIFTKCKMAAVRHLGFIGRERGTIHEGQFMLVNSVKIVMIGLMIFKL